MVPRLLLGVTRVFFMVCAQTMLKALVTMIFISYIVCVKTLILYWWLNSPNLAYSHQQQ